MLSLPCCALHWELVEKTKRAFTADLAAAFAALLLFVWLALEVRRGATISFDLEVRGAVHTWASAWLTWVHAGVYSARLVAISDRGWRADRVAIGSSAKAARRRAAGRGMPGRRSVRSSPQAPVSPAAARSVLWAVRSAYVQLPERARHYGLLLLSASWRLSWWPGCVRRPRVFRCGPRPR